MKDNENRAGAPGPKHKDNLKSKLECNQLDLSLSSLEIVPVKELAALPKATCLDLSCNLLTSLGNDFSVLTHIVRLDLSKNRLASLPEDFGDLQRLQHLDLYSNALSSLPLSFARLNSLRWMDMRDNPLDSDLLQHAGECLNQTQCQSCAKKVVAYMKRCQLEDEERRQKQLQEERMRESAEKLEKELMKQRTQLDKKLEKERRRKELAKQRADNQLLMKDGKENGESSNKADETTTKVQSSSIRKSSGGLMCMEVFLGLLLFIAGMSVSIYIYCRTYPGSDVCVSLYDSSMQYGRVAMQVMKDIGRTGETFLVNARAKLNETFK